MKQNDNHMRHQPPQSHLASKAEYEEQLKHSDVRLQWDPAHAPNGAKHRARRAIQIGMRNAFAIAWASGSLFVDIVDVTAFVVAQRDAPLDKLLVPRERVLTPSDAGIVERLRISADFDGRAAATTAAAGRRGNDDENDDDENDA